MCATNAAAIAPCSLPLREPQPRAARHDVSVFLDPSSPQMKDEGLTPREMFRLNDPRRIPATVKQDVIPFCHLREDPDSLFPTFDFPPPPPQHAAAGVPAHLLPPAPPPPRVWVCSCAGAALLLESRASPHRAEHHPFVREIADGAVRFSHVFIDEAGQALVAESLVPLMLADASASVLLAGDPKQLGPALHSKGQVAALLSRSLLEECMAVSQHERDHQQQQQRAPRRVTQLVHNYRSHVDILSLPSRCARASVQSPPRPTAALGCNLVRALASGWQQRSTQPSCSFATSLSPSVRRACVRHHCPHYPRTLQALLQGHAQALRGARQDRPARGLGRDRRGRRRRRVPGAVFRGERGAGAFAPSALLLSGVAMRSLG